VVRPIHLSGSLCVLLEYKHVSQGVECPSGSPSSNKWFAVCTFGTHTYVLGVKCLSGSPSSNKWFAVCTFGTHTCVPGVECLSGSLSSNKWFVVCTFGTQHVSQG